MIRELLNNIIHQKEKSPFEVGAYYHNQDANQIFKVIELEPDMMVKMSKSPVYGPIFVDKDVYEYKYREGIITEVHNELN